MLVIRRRSPSTLSVQLGFVAGCVVLAKSPALSNLVMLDNMGTDVGSLEIANKEFGKRIKNVAHFGQLYKQRNARVSDTTKSGCRNIRYVTVFELNTYKPPSTTHTVRSHATRASVN